MLVWRLLQAKHVVTVIVVLSLASMAYAVAAANVVGETGAGQGTGTISGYTVTNVTYTLNSTDPSVLDAVDFDIAATAGAGAPVQVEIKVDASTSTWYSCTAGVAPAWSCNTTSPAINVADMDALNVVATE